MPNFCQPCQDRGVVRAAKLRLDGLAVCNACARGGDSAGVRRTFAAERDLNLPTAEPKLARKADRLPMHLSPEEFAELKAAGVKGSAVRMAIQRPPLRSEHGTLCLVCSQPGTNVFHTAPCPARESLPVAPGLPPAKPAALQMVKREVLPLDTYRTANPSASIVVIILEETAAALGMRVSDYRVRRKARAYVTLRHMASWVLRQHTALTMPAIGILMGGQHHTSVMHGVETMQARIDTEQGPAGISELIWKNACRRSQTEARVKDFQETSFAEGQIMARQMMLAGMRDVVELHAGRCRMRSAQTASGLRRNDHTFVGAQVVLFSLVSIPHRAEHQEFPAVRTGRGLRDRNRGQNRFHADVDAPAVELHVDDRSIGKRDVDAPAVAEFARLNTVAVEERVAVPEFFVVHGQCDAANLGSCCMSVQSLYCISSARMTFCSNDSAVRMCANISDSSAPARKMSPMAFSRSRIIATTAARARLTSAALRQRLMISRLAWYSQRFLMFAPCTSTARGAGHVVELRMLYVPPGTASLVGYGVTRPVMASGIGSKFSLTVVQTFPKELQREPPDHAEPEDDEQP